MNLRVTHFVSQRDQLLPFFNPRHLVVTFLRIQKDEVIEYRKVDGGFDGRLY